MRKLLFPIVLCVAGLVVLLSLGFWQLERLEWKEGVLAGIEARMSEDAIAFPEEPREETDEYRSVMLTGDLSGSELHVLISGTSAGTGYLAIRAVTLTDGRRILLDQGLLPLDRKNMPATDTTVEVLGNLLWPDDINSSTPEPDLSANIWFGRDLDAMAEALNTEPLLVVVRSSDPADPRLTPVPVNTRTIKNDHLEYAATWFGLAVVWALMSLYWVFRILRPKDA
ncbi:SURF1 family protein [Cognatiyoonia sp.]|uniref:SURF1 family protein n=1 Tax=Cognatiyoonia sp. TaxID=2211652 RepID=UPI003F69A6C3